MTPTIDLIERMKVIAARINSGTDSYAGRLDAWHKLGNVSGSFRTWKEMVEAAKAAFPVAKCQLSFEGVQVDAWGTFRVDQQPPQGLEEKAIPFTLADGKQVYVSFLGTVGKDYEVIQHTDGFEILDHLVGEIDGAHYETMGTLDFGRTVWGQVDPNVKIRVGEDVSDVLLSFHTSHDGSKAFDIYESIMRHVCRNTLKAGSLKRLAASLRVRHTKNAKERIKSLKQEIDEIRNVAMTMQERLTFLSKRKVMRDSMETVMNRLFPLQKKEDGTFEKSSGRRDNILASVLALYEYNDGDQFREQRGTAYNLLNSITEYTDHERGGTENRYESAVFGSGSKLKENALDIILQEAEKMPAIAERVVVNFSDLGLNVNPN